MSLAHPVVKCIVADNGTLSARLKPGRGLGLVRDLTKSLGGRLDYGSGSEYPSFLLVFLLTERERRANRAVATRRARMPRRPRTIPFGLRPGCDTTVPESGRHSVAPA
jgi:hypothetical protein